jgi:hypothetical protein
MKQDFDHVEDTGHFRTLTSESSSFEGDEAREHRGRRLLQALNATTSDQNALLQFKRELSDPNNTIRDWNPALNANLCNWTGVTCSNATVRRVVYLNLTGKHRLLL